MREKTFIKTIICNKWKKTGFIPFNLEIILSKIWEYQNIQDTRPTTPLLTFIPDMILDHISYTAKEIID